MELSEQLKGAVAQAIQTDSLYRFAWLEGAKAFDAALVSTFMSELDPLEAQLTYKVHSGLTFVGRFTVKLSLHYSTSFMSYPTYPLLDRALDDGTLINDHGAYRTPNGRTLGTTREKDVVEDFLFNNPDKTLW